MHMQPCIRGDSMKTVPVRDLQKKLKQCIDEAQEDRVVITRRGKPAALLVGVEGKDWETIILETDPHLLEAHPATPQRTHHLFQGTESPSEPRALRALHPGSIKEKASDNLRSKLETSPKNPRRAYRITQRDTTTD